MRNLKTIMLWISRKTSSLHDNSDNEAAHEITLNMAPHQADISPIYTYIYVTIEY